MGNVLARERPDDDTWTARLHCKFEVAIGIIVNAKLPIAIRRMVVRHVRIARAEFDRQWVDFYNWISQPRKRSIYVPLTVRSLTRIF